MKIIFLDRDGVINEYPGHGRYVTSLKEFRFISGAKEAIALLTKHKFDIYVISSQGGVSKGLMKRPELNRITKKMLGDIEKCGGRIKKVLYCLHTKDRDCDCKKPRTGLFKKAIGRKKIDLKGVYFVGDDRTDVEAGRNLGCRTILVLSGKSNKKDVHGWDILPDRLSHDLLSAVKTIIVRSKP